MKSGRKFTVILAMAAIMGLTGITAAYPDTDMGLLIHEDEVIGSVFLNGMTLEEIDLPCLIESLNRLVAQVDNHGVSYLKILLNRTSPEIEDILTRPMVFIQRNGLGKNNLVLPLTRERPYFLNIAGKDMYTSGVLPQDVADMTCTKQEN